MFRSFPRLKTRKAWIWRISFKPRNGIMVARGDLESMQGADVIMLSGVFPYLGGRLGQPMRCWHRQSTAPADRVTSRKGIPSSSPPDYKKGPPKPLSQRHEGPFYFVSGFDPATGRLPAWFSPEAIARGIRHPSACGTTFAESSNARYLCFRRVRRS